MQIVPVCKYLRLSAILCSILGIFPWQFMFVNKKSLQNLYAHYSRFMLGYYLVYLMALYIKLYEMLNDRNGIQVDAISANMVISLASTFTAIRQLVMRSKPGFRNLIERIIVDEQNIQTSDDEQVLNIYNNSVEQINKKSLIYLILLLVLSSQYVLRPLFVNSVTMQVNNITKTIKPLPLSLWFPVDEQEYYAAAYCWHTTNSFVGGAFLAYTDILMFNLIEYIVCQLRILHHVLRNIDNYKRRYMARHGDDSGDYAAYVTLVFCIKKHNRIMEMVNYFNQTMSDLMVLDFLLSSLQIASVLTQIEGEITWSVITNVVNCFGVILLRLFWYYYMANDIITLSKSLSYSLWESQWYVQPPAVKKMIVYFLMELQKTLELRIGPFNVMSLESFIAILRGAYSYAMLIYSVGPDDKNQ